MMVAKDIPQRCNQSNFYEKPRIARSALVVIGLASARKARTIASRLGKKASHRRITRNCPPSPRCYRHSTLLS